jgi:ribose-phosphate pyrophosphokinase
MSDRMKIFSGSSNVPLASEIAEYLGIELSPVDLGKFKDGEISVRIGENVRGIDVFLIQSTCKPVNDNLMELVLMVDAALRASANRITAVIPYFGYARQDRKVEPRVPISSKVVANILSVVGINRALTMDLHSDQIQGFFDIPVDNLFATPVVIDYLKSINVKRAAVISPDTGGAERARFLAKRLGSDLAIIDKRRTDANVSEVMNVIGDVSGKNCIIVDDMVDTAGSITEAAGALRKNGAKDIYCVATHPVLSADASMKLHNADFKEIIFTNTIPVPEEKKLNNFNILSMAPLFGEAIRRIHEGKSISSLFV